MQILNLSNKKYNTKFKIELSTRIETNVFSSFTVSLVDVYNNYRSEIYVKDKLKKIDIQSSSTISFEVEITPKNYNRYVIIYQIQINGVVKETFLIQFTVSPTQYELAYVPERVTNITYSDNRATPTINGKQEEWGKQESLSTTDVYSEILQNTIQNIPTLLTVTSSVLDFIFNRRTIKGAFGKNLTNSSLIIECTFNEETIDEVGITTHPVEFGATITDHSFVKPTRFTITGGFNNNIFSTITNIVDRVSSIIDGDLGDSLIETQYKKLLEIKNARQMVTIFTKKRKYENMICTSLTVSTNAKTENVLNFKAVFQEIIVATVSQKFITYPTAKLEEQSLTNTSLVDTGNAVTVEEDNSILATALGRYGE